ncbi:MAG: hypothetical protein KAJ07_00520 [Planctomycetes bacterium]|nr:hypothetical protein [Planctomycetota bacterium]
MLTGLLGLGASILGLAKKADDSETVQKLLEGVDHLNFTNEEKIEYIIEQKKLAEAGENSIRSVTRRILAVIIIGTAFAFLWLAVIFWKFNKPFSDFLLEVLKLDIVHRSVVAVVAFYFIYYGVGTAIDKWKGKK